MISVSQAEKIITNTLFDTGNESVHYSKLLGRVLAKAVCAKRAHPPFDRVTMDGIAINSQDWDPTQPDRTFTLQDTQMAGQPALSLQKGHCIEIMTGAVLAINADCVIPVEQISQSANEYCITKEYSRSDLIKPGRNIHRQGSDHTSGNELIATGTVLNATHIACLLSAGHAEATVKRTPRISIIMSGDELIEAGLSVKDHQIYASNAPSIAALLYAHGYTDTHWNLIGDDLDELKRTISTALDNSDILITTGGVSMGKKDLLPIAFEQLEIECHFHKVTQKPGKPLWFGSHKTEGADSKKTVIFALPGNPVSALVTARRYVISALDKLSGKPIKTSTVKLDENVQFAPALSYFLPVKIEHNLNCLVAKPMAFNTSGDTVGLMASDGFIELDATRSYFDAGELVEYFPW